VASDPPDLFQQIAQMRDEEIHLDQAALAIARDEFQELDIAQYLKLLDVMASTIAELLPAGAAPHEQLDIMNDFLFNQRRFRGNTQNYYDARNSYLNEVLDRRTGIPITLSIIYIELARRLKLPVRGVNMPGHFIVRYDAPGVDLFVDPFNNGRVLQAEDCHEIILHLTGGRMSSFTDYLKPTSNRVILTRLLTNLKMIYFHQNDMPRSTRVLDRILLLNPQSTAEYKERGLLHFAQGRYRTALCDFIQFLNNSPESADTELVQQHIDAIISQMNQNN
jgi:regulator of sirC expression with transglutaminase-like and TPR domain